MSDGVKETICMRCVHLPVCSKKETYLKIKKALDKELSYFATDFIEPVEPKCKYYCERLLDVNIRDVN